MAIMSGKAMCQAFASRCSIPSTVPIARDAVMVKADIVLALVDLLYSGKDQEVYR